MNINISIVCFYYLMLFKIRNLVVVRLCLGLSTSYPTPFFAIILSASSSYYTLAASLLCSICLTVPLFSLFLDHASRCVRTELNTQYTNNQLSWDKIYDRSFMTYLLLLIYIVILENISILISKQMPFCCGVNKHTIYHDISNYKLYITWMQYNAGITLTFAYPPKT